MLLRSAIALALVVLTPAPALANDPVTPPRAPLGLGTQFVSATTVDLSWQPATPGTNPVAAYEVYARRPGWITPDQLVATTTTAWAFVPVGGLRPATAYELFVRARDTTGVRGPASAPAVVVTLAREVVSGAPVATAVTATTATVSWRPPAVGTARVAGYDLVVPPAAPTQPVQMRASTGPTVTSVQLTGLRPASTSTFVVVVRYTDGTPRSAPSSRDTVTTPPSVPPSPPTDLPLAALTPTSATLTWSPSAPGDFPIARYLTYVNGAGLGDPNPGPDNRTITFGVSPGNSYAVPPLA